MSEITKKKEITIAIDGELCDWRECPYHNDYYCHLYMSDIEGCNDGDEYIRHPQCLDEFGE